jgi:hypothetical protein
LGTKKPVRPLSRPPRRWSIKNRGTIIVQVSIGNIAAPIEKIKAPVFIGSQASAYQEMKSTNFLDTIKNYGTFTVTILFLVIIFIGYRYTYSEPLP